MDIIREKLSSELTSDLNALYQLGPETKEYQDAVRSTSEVHKMFLETDKHMFEKEEKIRRFKREKAEKEQEFILKAGTLVVGTCGLIAGYRFEKTGTFTSPTFKNGYNKLISVVYKLFR